LAVFQFSFQVAAVEKPNVHRAGSVADGYVEDGAAAALEADRGAPSACDFGENCLNLARNYFGDWSETEAVFVAEGEIAEEIADGDDASSFESGGALRTYAVEIFDGVGQGDGRHRMGRWRITFISLVVVGCVSRREAQRARREKY
jgi:hypothetical protein